ncbi:MAG: hypothetical protein GY797_25250 [Deltaproteobacteria bacterium]|nr:hypothetical protein [Deltaproteobacteria bacterium]
MKRHSLGIPGAKWWVRKNEQGEFEAILLYHRLTYRLIFAETCVKWGTGGPNPQSTQDGLHALNNIPGVIHQQVDRLTAGGSALTLGYKKGKSTLSYRLIFSSRRKNVRLHKIFEAKSGLAFVL